jgi:predicted RNA-binding Zn-ribbon protein involved in translation (DUF1610 family)
MGFSIKYALVNKKCVAYGWSYKSKQKYASFGCNVGQMHSWKLSEICRNLAGWYQVEGIRAAPRSCMPAVSTEQFRGNNRRHSLLLWLDLE